MDYKFQNTSGGGGGVIFLNFFCVDYCCLLVIVLSVLWNTASDYHFVIFKLFFGIILRSISVSTLFCKKSLKIPKG